MKIKSILIVAILLLLFFQKNYSHCTSFCFNTDSAIFFGNTMDYDIGHGLIVVNKRNVSKTAIWYSNPAKWTSKYGSITVNQWGREFPARGMNEAGLAMGEMYLAETRFPDEDERPQLKLEQWMQYQLDNCATVQEVIESDKIIRMSPNESTSHFLVADSSGNCVSMEWLNGVLVYHTMETLPVKVLTNNTYTSSLAYYNAGQPPQSTNFSSLARFYRAAEMIDNYGPQSSVPAFDYALSILASVNQGNYTKWSLLYDIKNLRFYYTTNTNHNLCYVDFKSFDFSCNTPVKSLNVYTSYSGDVAGYFIDDNFSINYNNSVAAATALGIYETSFPDRALREMANYPASTICNTVDNISSPIAQDASLKLLQNSPNPFNSVTTVYYKLEKSSHAKLVIYDFQGRAIRILVNGCQNAGSYTADWDATNDAHKPVSPGIYFCVLKTVTKSIHSEMLLIR